MESTQRIRLAVVALLAVPLVIAIGCGGSGGSSGPANPIAGTITVASYAIPAGHRSCTITVPMG